LEDEQPTRSQSLSPQGQAMHELLRKAIDLHEDENIEEAVELYRQVLKKEPDSITAQHRLGVALTSLRQMEEAATAFRHVLQRCPHHIEAQLNLGICLLENGDAEGACRQFKFVVQVAPNWPGGHAHLGNALLKLQRAGEAATSYQRSLDITPSAGIYGPQSNVFMILGDLEQAMSTVRQALELDPNDGRYFCLETDAG
jgi:tetratricopeptide (TPR) repeat protein